MTKTHVIVIVASDQSQVNDAKTHAGQACEAVAWWQNTNGAEGQQRSAFRSFVVGRDKVVRTES